MSKALVQNPRGPGFESQVPPYCFVIFLQVFQRTSAIVAYHTSSCNQWTDGLQAKSDGPDGIPTMVPSQSAYAGSGKSTRGQLQWALILLIRLLFQAHTPLSLSILFLSIYFIYLYYLFIFHNFTNQSHFFLNKTKKNILFIKINSSIFIFINK